MGFVWSWNFWLPSNSSHWLQDPSFEASPLSKCQCRSIQIQLKRAYSWIKSWLYSNLNFQFWMLLFRRDRTLQSSYVVSSNEMSRKKELLHTFFTTSTWKGGKSLISSRCILAYSWRAWFRGSGKVRLRSSLSRPSRWALSSLSQRLPLCQFFLWKEYIGRDSTTSWILFSSNSSVSLLFWNTLSTSPCSWDWLCSTIW